MLQSKVRKESMSTYSGLTTTPATGLADSGTPGLTDKPTLLCSDWIKVLWGSFVLLKVASRLGVD